MWALVLFLTWVNYVCKCKCEQLPGCYVRRYRLNSFWNLGRISRLMFTLFVFYSLFSVDGILFCNCNEVVVWCVWINLPCRGLLLTSLAFSISRLENLIRSRFDWAKFFNQFEIILILPLEIVSVELNILEVQDKYLNLPPHPYDTILSWEIHSEPGRALWFSHTVKGLPSFPFSFSTFPLNSLEVSIT